MNENINKNTKATVKANILALMTEWCSEGYGYASDMNGFSGEGYEAFDFEEGKYLRINIVPKMVFTFLSDLQKIVSTFAYISFNPDSCYIKVNEDLWVTIYM